MLAFGGTSDLCVPEVLSSHGRPVDLQPPFAPFAALAGFCFVGRRGDSWFSRVAAERRLNKEQPLCTFHINP